MQQYKKYYHSKIFLIQNPPSDNKELLKMAKNYLYNTENIKRQLDEEIGKMFTLSEDNKQVIKIEELLTVMYMFKQDLKASSTKRVC